MTCDSHIPALVINLERHKDRLDWFSKNAQALGLSFERLDAVDAKDPRNAQLIKKHKSPNAKLSDVEVSCILSHRKAWLNLIASDFPYYAIFEDDIYICEDIVELLQTESIPEGVHLIKLETMLGKAVVSNRECMQYGKRKLHRLLTRHYGAAGYVLSRKAAKRLVELTEECNFPVDVVLFDEKHRFWNEFKVYQLIPAACVQDQFYSKTQARKGLFLSEIEEGRKARKEDSKRKNSINISFEFRRIRRYFRCVAYGAPLIRMRKVIPFEF